jgi:hypothetical protein
MPAQRTVRRHHVATRPHAPARHLKRPRPEPTVSFTQHPLRALPESVETPSPKAKKKLLTLLLEVVAVGVTLIVGPLIQMVVVGEILLLIYLICALVFRIDSRTTFLLALLSLGVVLVGTARANQTLASVFAVYAFLFLVIGTISLGREVRAEA